MSGEAVIDQLEALIDHEGPDGSPMAIMDRALSTTKAVFKVTPTRMDLLAPSEVW